MPAAAYAFRRLRCNEWVDTAARWLDIALWDACAQPVEWGALAGARCTAGLDLASVEDTTALVLTFPLDDGRVIVRPFFWVPAERVKLRTERDRVPYRLWVDQGAMLTTPGEVVDYRAIEAKIRELRQVYRLEEVGFDRWNAQDLITRLDNDNVTKVIEIGQGFKSLSPPMKLLEKLIRERALVHDGHPVLRWHVANTYAETDAAENRKPSKKKSSDRIDGVVALCMALSRAITLAPVKVSRYESDALAVIT